MTETMAAFESGYADVSDGGRLYWEHAGRGPVIVLIHAGLWDRRIWDAQMEPFAESHRVVRYDLRGFGRSSPLEQPFSAREDLAELLGALGIDQAALVGCSIGGGLAVDFAIEFPRSVSALVAVCAGASGDPTDDDEATIRVLEEAEALAEAGEVDRALELELGVWTPPGDDPSVDARIREIAFDNKAAETAQWSLSRRLDPPAFGRLGEVSAPTLVVAGERDASIMAPITDNLAAGIPGARKVVAPGADHLPMMRRPVEFNRIVLGFLDSVAV